MRHCSIPDYLDRLSSFSLDEAQVTLVGVRFHATRPREVTVQTALLTLAPATPLADGAVDVLTKLGCREI